MGFLDRLLTFFQDLFALLFASSSPEHKLKLQIKNLKNSLRQIEPPIYRQDGYILPSFPAGLHQIFNIITPVKDLLNETIASTDKRVSEKYADFLFELVLPEEQRAILGSLTFAKRSEALTTSMLDPERVIEEQGKQFALVLKYLDSPAMKSTEVVFDKLFALADFCDFNFNSFFASFDPAFQAHEGKDSTVENPSFNPVEVAEIIPSLLDLYYLLVRLEIQKGIADILAILDAKRNGTPLSEDGKNRIYKLFQAVNWLLENRINHSWILTIIRLTKEDPEFRPEIPVHKTEYLRLYRNRKTEFFHSDSKKLLKERQDTEILALITETFGSAELEKLSGYNAETNDLLQEFTQFSLEWIHPLQIIKTFALRYFQPHFRQILHSVIVEGYFNNRSLQSSLSSAFFYCDSIPAKTAEFETLFEDTHPCSIKVLTGYLTELKKGMDFEKPLRKMVDNMNGHAKAFVQQAVNQYTEVYNFSLLIIEDFKKTTPDYITNIRTLAYSTKNSESYGALEKEIGVYRNFLDIMKKYAIVGTLSVPVSLTEQAES